MSAPKILLFLLWNSSERKRADCQLRSQTDRPRGRVARLCPTNGCYCGSCLVALSGEADHPNAEASSNPDDAVAATIFEITEQELAAADSHEAGGGYGRISVTLGSGSKAWVYVRA
jgi:hypothetical protein